MPRINPVTKETAPEGSKPLLEAAEKKMGNIPNIIATMAHSPATLGFYLQGSQALGGASISGKAREAIALAVAEQNNCSYCAAAHTKIGTMMGLSDAEVMDARRGTSKDAKLDVALRLAQEIVNENGFVSDDTLKAARDAGWTDGEITEIVAVVSINVFTNFINHVADTALDFPAVPELAKA